MNEVETQLKKIENIIGYELPEYFKQFYQKHNGGKLKKLVMVMKIKKN